MALRDVERLCELCPEHVSWYQLTLEPNTVFHARPPAGIPDQDLAWSMQIEGGARLEAAGYEQYEISAFAQAGHRCRHNLNYWTFGDYLAVGAGAHGKISGADGIIRRYCKPSNPAEYMQAMLTGRSAAPDRKLGADDIGFEFMLNALRLRDGFAITTFTAHTGLPPSARRKRIASGSGRSQKACMMRQTRLMTSRSCGSIASSTYMSPRPAATITRSVR